MAKSKRKVNRRKVSKEIIRQASWAKQHGLLSKRTKLNGGRVSRAVEKRIAVLVKADAVPQFEFRAGMGRAIISHAPTRKGVKVTKAQRSRAKEAGLLISNGLIIIPKEGDYQSALDSGLVAGHRPKDEDNAFSVDTILLAPEGIRNFRDLYEALDDGRLDEKYLVNDRLYAFTIFGYHPRAGATFLDGLQLREFLNKYQFDDNEEAFQNFELVTVPRDTDLGPTPPEIKRFNRLRFMSRQDRREGIKRKSYQIKAKREQRSTAELEEMNRIRVARWRENQRKRLGNNKFKSMEAKARARRRKAK